MTLCEEVSKPEELYCVKECQQYQEAATKEVNDANIDVFGESFFSLLCFYCNKKYIHAIFVNNAFLVTKTLKS